MPAGPIYAQYQIIHYNGGKVENKTAHVVTEKPLTVFLNHNELSTLICSPVGLEELVVGFLLSEGLVR